MSLTWSLIMLKTPQLSKPDDGDDDGDENEKDDDADDDDDDNADEDDDDEKEAAMIQFLERCGAPDGLREVCHMAVWEKVLIISVYHLSSI